MTDWFKVDLQKSLSAVVGKVRTGHVALALALPVPSYVTLDKAMIFFYGLVSSESSKSLFHQRFI